ncbi:MULTISPECIES: glutaredoxin domain-containing protein [Fusobacterium]|uniref:Glutaredoxin family protein n=1 Tax=Fusobacterium hominis TaxID=2764326 RepID=A0A7G9GWP0_9FUSO|nr:MULTISPECIES: glutaredoxin domain-containing protein [Fusobacterium]QNM15222.1 glutaredoxin family protein [Fusobacterium hominis]
MIKIYGKENCGKCKSLKAKLENDGIEFEYIEDIKTLMTVASKARIMSAPVVEKDGNFYTMEKFLEVL